jgi:hypothetical protein
MSPGATIATEALTAVDRRQPMQSIPGPECGRIAEILDRFQLRSTDGPIEHLRTRRPVGHVLTPVAETLDEAGRHATVVSRSRHGRPGPSRKRWIQGPLGPQNDPGSSR